MAALLQDHVRKWATNCTSVEELPDILFMEQLVNTLLGDICVGLDERKPKNSEEAC